MSSESYHEPYEVLSEETTNMHRALVSVMEELEAIDWYQQRAEACSDGELRAVLLHNREEEIEHAVMTLEWIRRRDPGFDTLARRYLFSDGPLLEIEGGSDAREAGAAAAVSGCLGIGSLNGRGRE